MIPVRLGAFGATSSMRKIDLSISLEIILFPQPNCRPELCKLKGKDVIALFIEEGSLPPYGLDAAKPRFYIRRGATTFPATQAEIRAFVRKTDSRIDEYPFGHIEL